MRAVKRAAREATDASRLMLAAKTAFAATLAWYLAPFLPLSEEQYAYYAPLGVLVSMYPTVASSARSGMQALAGLALGLGLGLIGLWLVSLGLPGPAAVAVVVGMGVLFGGIQALGVGQMWVAFAALFVILLGGADPQDFSVSYLVNMAFGVALGFVVNLIALPPLELKRARSRLAVLRDSLAAQMNSIADSLETGPFNPDELESAMDELSFTVSSIANEVRAADSSARGNPRARGSAQQLRSENTQRLRALERVAFFTRDLADALIFAGEEPFVDDDVRPRLIEAVRRCADMIDLSGREEEAPARLRAAEEAVDGYFDALDAQSPHPSRIAEGLTAGVSLRRMVEASRPFVRDDSGDDV